MMDTSEFKSSDAESVHPSIRYLHRAFCEYAVLFPGILSYGMRIGKRESLAAVAAAAATISPVAVFMCMHTMTTIKIAPSRLCPISLITVDIINEHTHSHTRSDNIIYGIWIWLGNMSDLIIIHYGRSRDAFLLLSRCFIWTDARTLSLRSPSWPFEKPAELFELKL